MASTRPKAMVVTIEDTYGLFKAPDALTEGILLADPTITPVALKKADRKIVQPYYGHGGQVKITSWSKVKTLIELVGSGAAGEAPPWAALLRACGFAMVLPDPGDPDPYVEFIPVSRGIESLSGLAWYDEKTTTFTGMRGNMSVSLKAGEVPHFEFEFTGIKVGMVDDVAGPGAKLAQWQKPLGVCKDNTSIMTIFGHETSFYEFSIDMQNKIVERDLPGQKDVPITDRAPRGSLIIPTCSLSEKDFYKLAEDTTQGALEVTHGMPGKHDGRIVGFRAPKLEITDISNEDRDGDAAYKIDFVLCPQAGNDEIIVFAQ